MATLDTIADAVEALLDVSTEFSHDNHSDETFTYCHVCDEWEGHKEKCFVPVLKAWQEAA